uniref:Aspartate dehydrogenase domain-containing protein n=1 Tax=Petromyzon marinus TaxID=7757 RepID=A0AAJ7TF92_PETMA|nr:putative L-aspartate dehydrogenase [Petromyzon marinus]
MCSASTKSRRRVGIVGYGHLGEYLVRELQREGGAHGLELAFVWNRSAERMQGNVEPDQQLRDLERFAERRADLIVEVSHPNISRDFGEMFLQHADYLVGSPTALADAATERRLREASATHGRTLYVPAGAFWGGDDIQKMADRGTLKALTVTMTKHPASFKLEGALRQANAQALAEGAGAGRRVLYEGPVRHLCPLAPNNVNTMAAAAMAAHNLGFDGVTGRLVADSSLPDWHIVEIEVRGVGDPPFSVTTTRRNPALPGAVTGNATYASFLSSLLGAKGHGGRVCLC